MKQIWFKKAGWIYLPIHLMGILITLDAIVFMVPVCMAVFKNVHSVSDGLYEIFIYGTLHCFLVEVGCRKNFLNS